MKSKKFVSLLLIGAMTTALLAVSAQAAEAPAPIRVGSYKGTTLTAGETSGLIIYPNDVSYTVASDDPAVVTVANVLGYWTATAQGPGAATVTVSAPDGRASVIVFTVKGDAPANEDYATPDADMKLRLELVRLINQTRRANGASELPVSDALMDAAQTIADKRYSWHHTQEECEAVAASGYPNGFGTNLTVFTSVATEDTAQRAVDNWISSPGHFQTMIDPDCDSIGVGVTEIGTVTYCYMFIGIPNSVNPYYG